jgi:flagellar biosynthesis GTPase FlhF
MAMLSGGSRGGGGYSYSYTKTYSLIEAIEQASRQYGSLEPDFVYGKLPPVLQAELDRLANHRFFGGFLSLSRDQQRSVMATLKMELEQQEDDSKRGSLSLLGLLTLARDGIAEPAKVFSLLPEETRKVLDASAKEQGAVAFDSASPRQQVAALEACVRIMNEADARRQAEEAKRKAEADARRQAEEAKRKAAAEARRQAEEAKRKAEAEARRQAEEAKRKAEAEARRQAEEVKRRSENRCILCRLKLGIFHRLLRRDRHSRCILRKG